MVIQLQNSGGLKLKPESLNLPIAGGAVDPIDGVGDRAGKRRLQAKRGKGKAKVTITALNLGANGGPGSISAKVGKSNVVSIFATLTGGSVARYGWGATISNIKATIAGKGAQALNRRFLPHDRQRSARSPRAAGSRPASRWGRSSRSRPIPRSVEVVPGRARSTLHTSAAGPLRHQASPALHRPLPSGTPPASRRSHPRPAGRSRRLPPSRSPEARRRPTSARAR